VAVACRGDAPIKQIARDFGISESCLRNWLQVADVEDGNRPGATASESVDLREARERVRLLEQRTRSCVAPGPLRPGAPAGKMIYPLVRELAVDGVPVAVTCRVLKLA
jgi:transposase-like protein